MQLSYLGWNAFFQSHFSSYQQQGFIPGRIIAEHKERYQVSCEAGTFPGEVSGRLRFSAASPADFPKVGDWVACISTGAHDPVIIQAVLPRQSCLARRAAGQATEQQVIAANLDYIGIVMGLDHNFNPARLQRYLVMARESGAQPLVLLNKVDLITQLAEQVKAVKQVSGRAPVLSLSALHGQGIAALDPWVQAGKTLALVGSSGVGKSTLINRLLETASQRTQEAREGDGRGRHTTTHRELFHLANGAMLIDTPGMRELQLWESEEGLQASFPEIEALAGQCRYADCQHEQEPGCAILEAIALGEMEASQLKAYKKLQREQAYLEDQIPEHEKRAAERKFHRMIRKIKHSKR